MASSPLLLFALLFISASQAYRVEVEHDARPQFVPEHFFMAGKPDGGQVISLYIGLDLLSLSFSFFLFLSLSFSFFLFFFFLFLSSSNQFIPQVLLLPTEMS